MTILGAAGDGGHAGAAVCRPEANPNYPQRLLGDVDATNFHRFAAYLGAKMNAAGFVLETIEDGSISAGRPLVRGGKHLLTVIAAALIVGLLLVLFHPAFRRDAIVRSNTALFPQVETSSNDERGPAADESGVFQE